MIPLGYDDLVGLVHFHQGDSTVDEAADLWEQKREAWGIDSDAVTTYGAQLAAVCAALSPNVLTAITVGFSAGFDLGVAAAFELETRRMAEQEAA